MIDITLRIDLAKSKAIGPGKIALLEQIDRAGSISGAGRAMKMSYRRAWLLVEELNRLFRDPVVTTKLGGAAGGGAVVTPFGHSLIRHYRQMETTTRAALAAHLSAIDAAARPPRRRPRELPLTRSSS